MQPLEFAFVRAGLPGYFESEEELPRRRSPVAAMRLQLRRTDPHFRAKIGFAGFYHPAGYQELLGFS